MPEELVVTLARPRRRDQQRARVALPIPREAPAPEGGADGEVGRGESLSLCGAPQASHRRQSVRSRIGSNAALSATAA